MIARALSVRLFLPVLAFWATIFFLPAQAAPSIPLTPIRRVHGPAVLRLRDLKNPPGATVEIRGRTLVLNGKSTPLRGDGLVIDGQGVVLRGTGEGGGLHVQDVSPLVIKNLRVTRYHWGMVIEDCREVRLQDIEASNNANHFEAIRDTIVMDMSGAHEPDYGGGLLLRHVTGGRLSGVKAQEEWNGVTLSGCSHLILMGCDFSYNDDTGLHLWSSSDNVVRDNVISWVGIGIVRDRKFVENRGDDAGILLEHDSSRNKFLNNQLVHDVGDGVFIRANELMTDPSTKMLHPAHPSNDNLFQGNDASYATAANAFEADFCSGNLFVNNIAAYSNFGFWLGFSHHTLVQGNLIAGNRTRGLQLDNGEDNTFENNHFIRAGGSTEAIHLSSEETGPDRNGGAINPSRRAFITGNRFDGFQTPLRLIGTSEITIRNNVAYTDHPDGFAWAATEGPASIQADNRVLPAIKYAEPLGPLTTRSNTISWGTAIPLGGLTMSNSPQGPIRVLTSLSGKFAGEEAVAAELLALPNGQRTLTFPISWARAVHIEGSSFSGKGKPLAGDRSLAHDQPVTASGNEAQAHLAVDGDTSTPEQAWRPPTGKAGDWWQVDLGARRLVTSVSVTPNAVNPHDFWGKFHIESSPTGEFTGEERTVLTETDWDHRPGPVRVYSLPLVQTRYLRVIGDQNQNWVQFEEFGVYGLSGP